METGRDSVDCGSVLSNSWLCTPNSGYVHLIPDIMTTSYASILPWSQNYSLKYGSRFYRIMFNTDRLFILLLLWSPFVVRWKYIWWECFRSIILCPNPTFAFLNSWTPLYVVFITISFPLIIIKTLLLFFLHQLGLCLFHQDYCIPPIKKFCRDLSCIRKTGRYYSERICNSATDSAKVPAR